MLTPAVDRVNPDDGSVETLVPSGSGEDFNFVAFAQEDFEDAYYSSRLRIEKLDAETGDNIIHDGALLDVYKRQVVDGWLNSSGHKKNMLDSKWKETGVGVYITEYGYDVSQLYIK